VRSVRKITIRIATKDQFGITQNALTTTYKLRTLVAFVKLISRLVKRLLNEFAFQIGTDLAENTRGLSSISK